MKKFLKYIIIFFAPLIILGICLEVMLRHIPNDYAFKKKYLDKNAANVTVLVLGNSHAFYGINPAYITGNSFNAAIHSQALQYDYEILNKYQHSLNNLQYIVLSVDYSSLYSNLIAGFEKWRVKNYSIYYGIHTNYNLSDNSELFANKADISIERIKKYYTRHSGGIMSSALGWAKNDNVATPEELTASGERDANIHTATNDAYLAGNTAMLKNILNFAKSRNIKVLLFTAPACNAYVKNLNITQLNNTVTAINNISSDYSNTRYYNFLQDSTFTESDYFDADHLNTAGAQKLTIKIDSLLKTQ